MLFVWAPHAQRDALLAVCDCVEVWRSDDGETYPSVPVGDHFEHHAIVLRAFRDWMIGDLARRYTSKGRPASATEGAVRNARMGLEARAYPAGRSISSSPASRPELLALLDFRYARYAVEGAEFSFLDRLG